MQEETERNSGDETRAFYEQLLGQSGYGDFENLWSLPHEFVDEVNYRRNGWSAVSVLTIAAEDGREHRFFLKRQENQLRYSLRHPFGVLTYQFEIEAIEQMVGVGLPCVNVVDHGFRTAGGKRQGYVLTKAIDGESLLDFATAKPDWDSVQSQLQHLAQELFKLHSACWQHGALYPVHIFVNWTLPLVTFIDLERARRRRTPLQAAEADFFQFLKRCDDIPDSVLQTLLAPYQKTYPDLLERLKARFPKRQLTP